MSTRKQLAVAAGIVALSVAVILVYTGATSGRPPAASGGMGDMAGMNMGGSSGSTDGQPVHLTPAAARRIGVTYATAELRPFRRSVRTVASVTYDETRLADVDPKIEGWVEKLYVDFTGAPVRKGQPLLEVYSPMLVSAQEELILARKLADESAGAPASEAARNAGELLAAARRRLAYWDIPADEIARIEKSGTPRKTLTLRSPADGIVVEKNVVEGARIMPGMNLFRIADLATVWVEGDVFEKDLSLVSLGQHAQITLESYPGRVFDGRVTYIYPTVSTQTRTGRVRIALANPGLALKPGMYANATLAVPGTTALVVPRSAVLATGERTLVFVKDASGMLQPRDIQVGLANDTLVEVRHGLTAGDVVVSSAGFLVDAESNLGSTMGSMPGMDMGGSSTSTRTSTSTTAGHDDGMKDMPGMTMPAPAPTGKGVSGPGPKNPAPSAAGMSDMPGMSMPPASPAVKPHTGHAGH